MSTSFNVVARQAAAIATHPLAGLTVPRKAYLIAAACVVLLYAAHVNGRWRQSYDDAHYMLLGRSVAAGEGYRLNGHIDNVFPPGMALLLAGVYATVGQSFVAFEAIMVMFGLGALVLIHACLKRLTDPATALLVTLATALSYRFYSGAGKILSDIPTTMFFWLTMYLCLRGMGGRGAWLALATAVSVVAVLFRAAGVLMMGALGVGLVLDRSLGGTWRRRLWAAVAVALPALAMTLAFYALASRVGEATPRYETQFRDALGVHSNPIVAYGLRLVALGGELPRLMGNVLTGQQFWAYGLVILAMLLAGMAASAVCRRGLVPTICILYPLGLALVLQTDFAVQARMWFPIQPLLLLLALQGVTFLCALAAGMARSGRTEAAGKTAAALVAAVLLVTVGTSIPRVFKEAFINTYYGVSEKYYTKMSMSEVGAFLPIAAKAAELDRRDKPVFMANFHEAKMMQVICGRLWVLWPEVDQGESASAQSAQEIHRRAAEDAAISTALLPLKYRVPLALAREVRRAFDEDPAWRMVIENEYYALYQRAASTRGGATAHR
ncbi:MAG: ArnT family glycosyltransferase [Phycisphaerae bacterium]